MIIVWGYDNVNQDPWLTQSPWTPVAWDASTGDGGAPPLPSAGRHTTGTFLAYRTTPPA